MKKILTLINSNGGSISILDANLDTLSEHEKCLTKRLKYQKKQLAIAKSKKRTSATNIISESIKEMTKTLSVISNLCDPNQA